MAADRERMERVYRERKSLSGRYSLDNPGNRFNYELLRNGLHGILSRHFPDMSTVSLLDIGAGDLFWADQFVRMGCDRSRCIGSDVLVWRLREAHDRGRDVPAVAASGDRLPFVSGSFDLVCQFTMMTSILDMAAKETIAAEMKRVLRPGGYIIWYDFRYNNLANPNTRAIGKRELHRLFPGWSITAQTTTLIPQIARKMSGPLAPGLKFLCRFPILRSHYLALIGPKG